MMRPRLMATVSAIVLLVTALSDSTMLAVGADPPKAEAQKAAPVSVSQVLETGKRPADARLGALRKLDDKLHRWDPPTSKAAFEAEVQNIRERLLVSTGLWPMPPKLQLKPVIHGKIDRDDYTIEKVFFSTHPGHYVTGNLYRPKAISGKAPGVLCPHGHWDKGRFYDAGDERASQEIASSAEKTNAGAHYPLQARMAQLARMGCIVFHYDMVGYADSQQIKHAGGFTDAEASLRLQNFMGLQTFNSLRALDFLTSLPEVDTNRIGVTGASGGGTQTFMLCALDPRPTAAFPAVMVSSDMQGGCICENADYLRIGISNIAIASLFAPKPLGMSGAHDWTIDIETKGLPELKAVYGLFNKPDNVMAKCYPQFGHNYNNVSRELMENWFNEHLHLGLSSPVIERDFVPVPPRELSVFSDEHPLPADAQSSEQLRQYLTSVSNEQYQKLLPKQKSQIDEYRHVVGTAARIMLDHGVPESAEVQIKESNVQLPNSIKLTKGTIGRHADGEAIPFVILQPKEVTGKAVAWIDSKGKAAIFDGDKPNAQVAKLLDAGYSVISADVFMTGEFLGDSTGAGLAVDPRYSGYTYGYNRPLLSNRVRDILTVIGGAIHKKQMTDVSLVATGEAGPWTLLAAALANDSVKRAVVDVNQFRFADVKETNDAMFLPGALRYGDIGGLAALAVPCRLTIADPKGTSEEALQPLKAVYAAAGAKLEVDEILLTPDAAVNALLKK